MVTIFINVGILKQGDQLFKKKLPRYKLFKHVESSLFPKICRIARIVEHKMQHRHMFDWAGDTEEPLGYRSKRLPIVFSTNQVSQLACNLFIIKSKVKKEKAQLKARIKNTKQDERIPIAI